MGAQTHRSDPQILNRRTLERDHRVLASMLRPGMFVLDVGCGTGAITAGIARAVAPGGRVMGIDRDESLLEAARRDHPCIHFEAGDALTMTLESAFDVVTAARTVQWISAPSRAIARMAAALRPGGRLVVLDYNHQRNSWSPAPPVEFQRFYAAFLAWRASIGWANDIADRLPGLFAEAGLVDIESFDCDEVGGPDVWASIIDGLGRQFYPEDDRARVSAAYHDYREGARQTLSMKTVIGRRVG